jgi:hypothetical protein
LKERAKLFKEESKSTIVNSQIIETLEAPINRTKSEHEKLIQAIELRLKYPFVPVAVNLMQKKILDCK